MSPHSYQVISAGVERVVSLEEASELTGMQPEIILEFVSAKLVPVHVEAGGGDSGEHTCFDESALVRLRHIAGFIKGDVNTRAVRLIIDLLDRLEAADREIRSLRERLR